MAMMGVSLRAYARMRGCSLTAVQKAIASKRITTLPDGTIDPERANQEWAKNTFAGQTISRKPTASAPLRGGSAQPRASSQPPVIPQAGEVSSDPVAAYLRARAVNETFKAKVSQLEYEERTGKLILAVRASEYAATFSAIVKDGLMAMPDRLAPMLAAVDDEKTIHRMLAAEVSVLLRKVSKAVADAGL
ncbi:MAG: hypothetical protein WBL65_15890 [Bryobacteraceae bacterium]